MVQDFTAFRKISFQTVDVEVALAEIEYQYLKFICEATLRNSDEVLREQIRNLHIPGLPSFDDWRKQEAATVRGILLPSIETNTIPTTAIASQDSVIAAVEPIVTPPAARTSDRKPSDATTTKPTQTAPSESATSVTNNLLKVLSEPTTAKLTSREVIEQQHEKLTALLKEGKTMDELAALLTSNGAKISASTLRNYLSAARRKARASNATTSGKATRSGTAPATKKSTAERSTNTVAKASTPSAETAVELSQPSIVEATTDTAPAPIKPTRGRPKAAAKANLDHETSVTATRGRKPSVAEASPQAPTLKKRKGSRK